MTPKTFCKLAERLLRHPAVPYYEHAVRAEVEAICAEHGLHFRRDPFGNIIVRFQTSSRARPLALAAHLDHPGFEIVRSTSSTRCFARFCGGVPDHYFRPGIRIRVMPGAVPAVLGARRDKTKRLHEILLERPLENRPAFAVWEMDDFIVRRDRIHARACDDLIGVASILATLIDLKCGRAGVNVIGLISRAEEVGFHGALALAAGSAIPKNSFIISLETSQEHSGVKMGQGVILRVGDRTSIFDSKATRLHDECARTCWRLQGACSSRLPGCRNCGRKRAQGGRRHLAPREA